MNVNLLETRAERDFYATWMTFDLFIYCRRSAGTPTAAMGTSLWTGFLPVSEYSSRSNDRKQGGANFCSWPPNDARILANLTGQLREN